MKRQVIAYATETFLLDYYVEQRETEARMMRNIRTHDWRNSRPTIIIPYGHPTQGQPEGLMKKKCYSVPQLMSHRIERCSRRVRYMLPVNQFRQKRIYPCRSPIRYGDRKISAQSKTDEQPTWFDIAVAQYQTANLHMRKREKKTKRKQTDELAFNGGNR